MNSLQVPCPVRIGVVKKGGLQGLLHRYTLEKNLTKIEKLLKKGVDVDCVNNLGQTPLFCASLLGLIHVAELLLQYGANPNHRCEDQSTPLHAAVFSSNPWLLSGLLDAGGDLRLHDHKGKSPKDWAQAGAQENSARMLEFLKSCASHMHSLSQSSQSKELRLTPSSTSSKTLVRSPSLLELIRSRGSDLHLHRKVSRKSAACDRVQCFGYGKLCVEKAGQGPGLLAAFPLMGDGDLVQAEDEPLLSFTCGGFITMTNYSWKGCRVTVKELPSSSSVDYLDLLLVEQEYCLQLFHPNLLQLMAVCMSVDLQKTRLVYERVHMGSLHNVLHHKRWEYPLLHAEAMLGVALQACEALLYLHARGLVMRALSSHSVMLTRPAVAKLTDFGFMAPSDGSRSNPPAPLALPPHLYHWAAPEVIKRRPCTGKADLYSLCALIQELYTDDIPWGPVEPHWVKHAVDSGQALAADPNIPEPYYSLVRVGLQPRAQDRTHSLQDLRYTLRCDIKELSQAGRPRSGMFRSGWCPEAAHPRTSLDADPGAGTGVVAPENCVEDPTLDRETHHQLNQLDNLLNRETESEEVVEDEEEEEEEEEKKNKNRGQAEDEEPATDSESFIHRDLSFRDILPLDDWRLGPPARRAAPQSTTKEESDSSAAEEAETVAREKRVRPQRLPGNLSEHVSSIVLNLKVSQVLLQQSQSNLDAVESGRRRRPQGAAGGSDEVDAARAEPEAPDWPRAPGSPAACSLSSNSGSVSSSASRAVGPPSQYRLLPHGVHSSAKRIEAQLLTGESGGGGGALSAEELAVWRREFPVQEHAAAPERPLVECPSEEHGVPEGHSGSALEEPSHYSSAQENSFVNMRPRNKRPATYAARATETEEEPQSEDREEFTDRPYVSSETSDFLEDDSPTPQPRLPQSPSKAKWTTEVSDLVARMTRGRLGPTPGPAAGSSDSEDVEDRAPAPGPPRARQEPVGHSSSCHSRSSPGARAPSRRGEEKSGTELEHIFKSFAGLQSESEEDADFQTVNRTFDMTCGVWDGAGPKEEGTSESDYTQSPAEPSSVFYTPNLGPKTHPATGSQSPSSEEDLDVTVEVCRPSTTCRSSTHIGGHTQETRHWGEVESVEEEYEEIDTNPVISAHALFPLAGGLPDLAELADLSSITCSPAQLQERLHPSPLYRRPPPSNSTPRSPAAQLRVVAENADPVPPLPSLRDTPPCGNPTPPDSESFATATGSPGASSTTSVSSVLKSPERPDRSPEETGSPTGPPGSASASSGETRTRGPDGAGPGHTEDAETGRREQEEEEEERRREEEEEEEQRQYVEEERRVAEEEEQRRDAVEGQRRRHVEEEERRAAEEREEEESSAREEEEEEGESERQQQSRSYEEEESMEDDGSYQERDDACEEEDDDDDDEKEGVTCNDEDITSELSVESAEDERRLRDQELCEDQMAAVAPVMEGEAEGKPDIPSSLEETPRANSTLDEVLQGMMVERAAGHRVPRSPGPAALPPNTPLGVCEPHGEAESAESAGCPGGDCAEAEELKAGDSSDWVTPSHPTTEPTEKVDMGSHGNWSQPHRVIVLEQTPIKTGPDGVIRN